MAEKSEVSVGPWVLEREQQSKEAYNWVYEVCGIINHYVFNGNIKK